MGLKERHEDAVARHEELIQRMGAWAYEMDDLEDDGKQNSAQYRALEEKLLAAEPKEKTLVSWSRRTRCSSAAVVGVKEPLRLGGQRASGLDQHDPFGLALAEGLQDVLSGRAATAFIDPQTAQRTDSEKRALTDVGPAGTGLVPLQFGPAGFTLRASSVVLGLPGIRIVSMENDRMRFPRIAGVDSGGTDISVAGVLENASITETTPDVDAVDLYAVKFGVYHTLSSEFVEDATQDALSVFAQNALIQLGLRVDLGMLEGNGAAQLVGLRNTVGISTTSVAATPANFDKFVDTKYAAEAANATPNVWILHPRSWQTLSKIKTGIGESDATTLLEPNPQDSAEKLLGLPIKRSTQITLTEGAGAGSWVAADQEHRPDHRRRPARSARGVLPRRLVPGRQRRDEGHGALRLRRSEPRRRVHRYGCEVTHDSS